MDSVASKIACLIGEQIGTVLGSSFDFGQIAKTLLIDGRPTRVIGQNPVIIDDTQSYTAFHIIDRVLPAPSRMNVFSRPYGETTPIDLLIQAKFAIFGFADLTEVDAWKIVSAFNNTRIEKKDSVTGETLVSGSVTFREAIPDLITILTNLRMMDVFETIQAQQQNITGMLISYEVESSVCDFCIEETETDCIPVGQFIVGTHTVCSI